MEIYSQQAGRTQLRQPQATSGNGRWRRWTTANVFDYDDRASGIARLNVGAWSLTPVTLLIGHGQESGLRRQPDPFGWMPPRAAQALRRGPIQHHARQAMKPTQIQSEEFLLGVLAIGRAGAVEVR